MDRSTAWYKSYSGNQWEEVLGVKMKVWWKKVIRNGSLNFAGPQSPRIMNKFVAAPKSSGNGGRMIPAQNLPLVAALHLNQPCKRRCI
jgi:hypothetical protein